MKKHRVILTALFVAGFASFSRTQVILNEIMASNVLAVPGSDGEYEDWIELYNAGSIPVDLAGYQLGENLGGPFRPIPGGSPASTTIPAHGYLVLTADGQTDQGALHLDFKLNSGSGDLYLVQPGGAVLIDSLHYPKQVADMSYGRSPDHTGPWRYQVNYSPGHSNGQGYDGLSAPPVISPAPGFYGSPLSVAIQAAVVGDTIRYTLDGYIPSASSPVYSGPIPISSNTVLRARVYHGPQAPSTIATSVYYFDAPHSLPNLSLSLDPDDLFNPVTGIYEVDHDGREWERHAENQYFNNGSLLWRIASGARIQGNTGPTDYAKKSFRLYFRNGYGGTLDYPLYPDDPVVTFQRLVLKSGYDDSFEPNASNGTLIKDPLCSDIWQKLGQLGTSGRMAVMYLNQQYWGVYNIRESLDENFFLDHLRVDAVDLVRCRWDSIEHYTGNRTNWTNLVAFFNSNTFTSDVMLDEANRRMDLDNFMTLQAFIHATHYYSWAYGCFMVHPDTPDGRWYWTIWDTDRAYGDPQWNGFGSQTNPEGAVLAATFVDKLLQNMRYRNGFINRTADILNTVFLPENSIHLADSLAGQIRSEIPSETAKWGSSVTIWNRNLDALRAFLRARPAVVRQQFINKFGLSGTCAVSVDALLGGGRIRVNSVLPDAVPWSGTYFKGVPVALHALPDAGWRFTGWSDIALGNADSITITPSSDIQVEARFQRIGNIQAELISPSRVRVGQRLPVVVRIRDGNWGINPLEQTPVRLDFDGFRADSTILIKRGAGTGVPIIASAATFTLGAGNSKVPESQKTITAVSDYPSVNESGALASGDVVWDDRSDHVVTGTLAVPSGSRLIIKPGTWVVFKRYAGMDIRGRISVEGTASDPVVFASETVSNPWGGLQFWNSTSAFRYCFFVNGGGDASKGHPTNEDWHTGHQHILFAQQNSDLTFDQCFFLNSPGKVFGAQDSKITVANSVTSFVWHGGEFHRVRLDYRTSHLMNLPNDDHIYTGDIDTDGFHIDEVDPNHPEYSVIDSCFFVTGNDDAIDHHGARLRVSNCWLEDFCHEGVAASGGDTICVFNTVAIADSQGFECGWTEDGVSKGPFLFVDHCVAVGNKDDGLRYGDSYSNAYRGHITATNSIFYGNADNVKNYLNTTHASEPGAIDISYSMTNDPDYDGSPDCTTGTPQFDPYYRLLNGSRGIGRGMAGTNMGRADSAAVISGSVVINEIMYNAPSDADSKDWVELFNPQSQPQDVSGWIIHDGNPDHGFPIPNGIVIPAGGYWVFCQDSAAFKTVHTAVMNVTGDLGFGLGKNDLVKVAAPGGLADSVAYGNNGDWPGKADGKGYSLELKDSKTDNTLPANWNASAYKGGSPGWANGQMSGFEGKSPKPIAFSLEQNYPNPFNARTVIGYVLPDAAWVTLTVYNILGERVVSESEPVRVEAGRHVWTFDASNLASGLYVFRVTAKANNGSFSAARKMVVLK